MASLRPVLPCRRDSGRDKHEAFLFRKELLLRPVGRALVSTPVAQACLEVLAPLQPSPWGLARWQRAKLRLALSHRPGSGSQATSGPREAATQRHLGQGWHSPAPNPAAAHRTSASGPLHLAGAAGLARPEAGSVVQCRVCPALPQAHSLLEKLLPLLAGQNPFSKMRSALELQYVKLA